MEETPQIHKLIHKAESSGRLILFIGAGVSKIIGCPSWQELADSMLEKLWREYKQIDFYAYNHLKFLDPRKKLTICKELYKNDKVHSFADDIKNLLTADDGKIKEFGKIFSYLLNFNAIYITTNYDTYLENEVKKKNRKIIYKKEELVESNLNSGDMIYLHGNINYPDSMIITISDYLMFYQDEKVKTFLNKIFTEYNILFIGYGLEEYELLEFLVKSSTSFDNQLMNNEEIKPSPLDKQNNDEIRHVMLYPLFDQDKELLKFLNMYYRKLKILPITYSINKGYENLTKVLERWGETMTSFLEGIQKIDNYLLKGMNE